MCFRRFGFLAMLLLCACERRGQGALETGDPLHEAAIGLPPPELGLPPRADPPSPPEDPYPVPAPPFSEGIFPCSSCHAGGPKPADTRPAMPHKAHLDRDLLCADCHAPEDAKAPPTIPAASTCFDCHEDLAEEPPAVREYFDRIRGKDGSYVFPRRWKTRDTIANHPGHAAAEVGCEQCHGEVGNGPFVKPKSVPLMQRCLDCHALRSASTECATCHREIKKPQHENIVLQHGSERSCYDCHNPENRDALKLIDGNIIPYEESYRLCGQCHGEKLRDWKIGLHGKRTGMWDGRRNYLLCVHCHQNPHAPSFPEMEPLPPPIRPQDVK